MDDTREKSYEILETLLELNGGDYWRHDEIDKALDAILALTDRKLSVEKVTQIIINEMQKPKERIVMGAKRCGRSYTYANELAQALSEVDIYD